MTTRDSHCRTLSILFLTATATATLAVGACTPDADPIANSWRSPGVIGSYHNTMDIADGDGRMNGRATVYFYYDDELYYADFDVDVSARGEGSYELEMDCDGDCGDLDFEMDCDLNRAGDELDCEGDGLWRDYELVWELD